MEVMANLFSEMWVNMDLKEGRMEMEAKEVQEVTVDQMAMLVKEVMDLKVDQMAMEVKVVMDLKVDQVHNKVEFIWDQLWMLTLTAINQAIDTVDKDLFACNSRCQLMELQLIEM